MKKWMIFVLGVFVGMIIVGFINLIKLTSETKVSNVTETKIEEDDGITTFKEPGEAVKCKSFKVFQVLADNAALVRGEGDYKGVYTGIIYLLINEKGEYYYDDQIINVPKGSVARQIGIYKYYTNNDMQKTVPMITIMNE